MTNVRELLDRIRSVEWEAGMVASSPGLLRRLLRLQPEVVMLREAYDSGCLTEEGIRAFVEVLLREGCSSPRFPFQTALSAIAVMLEPRFSKFAEEYINDLACVRSPRFATAAEVAREIQTARNATTPTLARAWVQHANTAEPIKVDWLVPRPATSPTVGGGIGNTYETLKVA